MRWIGTKTLSAVLAATLSAGSALASAQEKVLNLYSSRHYQTDESLYSNFTKRTGIRVNRIEAGEDPLIERLKNEAASSPADVLVTVDAGRLWRAEQLGLFQPIKSKLLESRLAEHLRASNDQWFGFSARARVIVYNKAAINPADVQNYEDLASPKLKGKVCTRSGNSVYNLSLMSALIEHWGERKAEDWARGVVSNFARAPKGGDTDQILGVAAGECGVAITNSYYYVRLLKSEKPEDKKIVEAVGLIWPNQKSFGTHMNISGAGVLKSAPHRDAAIQYLEYLASDSAQAYFANGNNEWPVAKGVKLDNAALISLGNFKMDTLNISALGKNQPLAQKIFDRAGFK
ncbi:MAG: Fe(3+) transporter substrate-binding protein [Betaproteobacteria bacterium]|jgi:iron(III) transport system substrate-binding protein|nr:Fe(3+) transporter substrate-binding protein [Betaproteobacteria bacterium]